MEKIKVIRLRSARFVGGPGKSILTFASKTQCYDVIIVSFVSPKKFRNVFIDEARKLGLKTEVVRMSWAFDVRGIFRLISLIKKTGTKILHTHGYKEDVIGYFAAKATGVKKVAMVHGWTGHTLKVRIYELLDKFILRFFDKVIVVTESLKKKLLRIGVPGSKIVVIHNAIDLAIYSQRLNPEKVKSEFGIQEGEKIIGTVGRLSKEKGYKYFLEASAEIVKVYPDVRFIIVGDGPERENLKGMSRKLGIDDRVIFTGYRNDDVDLFFSAFDVFVLPSLTEGLPNVILEAFAFRKPVVATDVGGVSELVKHKETGFLVRPKDIKGLVQGITFFLENPDEVEKMAYEEYRLVKEKFSVEERVRRIEKLYQDLFNERKDEI